MSMGWKQAGIVAFGICGAATAAMAQSGPAAPKPVAAPVAALPASPWQGFYVGTYAAHDLTALDFHASSGGETANFDGLGMEGVYGGALLGFNHPFAARGVASLEVQGAFGRGLTSFSASDGGTFGTATIDNNRAGSLRGRVGFLLSPATLVYTALGAMVAHASYGCDTSFTTCPPRTQETLYGWLFAGIGAETAFAPSWRVRYGYAVKFLKPLSFDVGIGTPLTVTP
jgi:outer membrane immunogenic protein